MFCGLFSCPAIENDLLHQRHLYAVTLPSTAKVITIIRSTPRQGQTAVMPLDCLEALTSRSGARILGCDYIAGYLHACEVAMSNGQYSREMAQLIRSRTK